MFKKSFYNNKIAISMSDWEKWGCPMCGCESAYGQGVSGGYTTPVTCRVCDLNFIVLGPGITKSAIGFGTDQKDENGKTVCHYPTIMEHPRKGLPKVPFIIPDVRAEKGEYCQSRGVGYDLAIFVHSKISGERIVKMFKKIIGFECKTWLDWRESSPTWIQVKISPKDVDNHVMDSLLQDGIITEEKIRTAMEALK